MSWIEDAEKERRAEEAAKQAAQTRYNGWVKEGNGINDQFARRQSPVITQHLRELAEFNWGKGKFDLVTPFSDSKARLPFAWQALSPNPNKSSYYYLQYLVTLNLPRPESYLWLPPSPYISHPGCDMYGDGLLKFAILNRPLTVGQLWAKLPKRISIGQEKPIELFQNTNFNSNSETIEPTFLQKQLKGYYKKGPNEVYDPYKKRPPSYDEGWMIGMGGS